MDAPQKDSPHPGGDASAEEERLKEELAREHQMYLRALADFENYRRRVERESASRAYSGKREILLPLLDLTDSFDRALAQIGDAPTPWADGLLAIHRKLLGLLETQDVKPIATLGEAFDPALHEAVGSVSSDEHEPGVVVEEVQRGYRWGDELLRPARVRVAQ